jgi:hypothetical protein
MPIENFAQTVGSSCQRCVLLLLLLLLTVV